MTVFLDENENIETLKITIGDLLTSKEQNVDIHTIGIIFYWVFKKLRQRKVNMLVFIHFNILAYIYIMVCIIAPSRFNRERKRIGPLPSLRNIGLEQRSSFRWMCL